MGGGRIMQNKLWFYLTYREWGAWNTVPNMWFNKNAGNPNAWAIDFVLTRPAFSDNKNRNGIGRITWQASPRNKVNLYWSEQYNTGQNKGGGSATFDVEETNRSLYQPSRQPQASWSSPVSGRLLLEAGWGMYQARYRF